jgi:hypothetical protein
MKEYLAVITTPYGGGSYARSDGSETKEEVARRARRIFISDWKHLFNLKKGAKLKVNIVDVTGLEDIEINDFQITVDGEPIDRPIEILEV